MLTLAVIVWLVLSMLATVVLWATFRVGAMADRQIYPER